MGDSPLHDRSLPLEGFPHFTLKRGAHIFRACAAGVNPIYFATGKYGPFNLPSPYGTFYAGLNVQSTTAEFLGPGAGIHHSVIETHAHRIEVATIYVRRAYRLAAIDHVDAAKFGGVRQSYQGFGGYAETQASARKLAAAGFDGILFSSRYTETPYLDLVGLFGRQIDRKIPSVELEGTRMDGVTAAKTAGFQVVPWQTKVHLDII